MNRAEYIAWAKQRAVECLDEGGPLLACQSLQSDLINNPDTAGHAVITLTMMELMAGRLTTTSEVLAWIDGVQ